jgi:sugar (pentulose or hexulose) kinase
VEPRPLLLGLDLGTSRGKALIVDRYGHESGSATVNTPFLPRGDRTEMSVDAGVPVTLAGHDHLAALSGAGAGMDDFGNSVGTAESVVALTRTFPEDRFPGGRCPGGGTGGRGRRRMVVVPTGRSHGAARAHRPWPRKDRSVDG